MQKKKKHTAECKQKFHVHHVGVADFVNAINFYEICTEIRPEIIQVRLAHCLFLFRNVFFRVYDLASLASAFKRWKISTRFVPILPMLRTQNEFVRSYHLIMSLFVETRWMYDFKCTYFFCQNFFMSPPICVESIFSGFFGFCPYDILSQFFLKSHN